MKSNEEIKKWLLENCVDSYGDLHLGDLDFTDFNGNIYLGKMKVKDDVIQGWQKVGGNLYQSSQAVEGDIFQDEIECSSKSQAKVDELQTVEIDKLKTETNELIKENQELKEKLEGYETLLLYIAKGLKEGGQNDK